MINNKQYESTKRELENIRKHHIIKQKEFHKWVIEAKKRYEEEILLILDGLNITEE